MFKNKNYKDEKFMDTMKGLLDALPARDPATVEEGKARFLAQARLMQQSPVTPTIPQRHNKWNFSKLKEAKMGTVITIIVIFGLALGGSSAVYAAQDDLPDDLLYPVKLLSEGIRLNLTSDPQKKSDLDLQFALKRLDEIEEMIELGLEPPDRSYARLENQLMHAVGQATLLDEEEVPGTLLRIRETLQERLRSADSELDSPSYDRLRTTLQTRLSWLDAVVADPLRFTYEARKGWEPTLTVEPGTITETVMPGEGYKTPGPGYKTPGPGYKTPAIGDQTPAPGYQTPGPGYQTPGPGYQTAGPGSQNTEQGNQAVDPDDEVDNAAGGGTESENTNNETNGNNGNKP